MANVYLLVTDRHDNSKNKENRFNYKKEIEYADKQLESTIERYKTQGHNVYVIYLGDLYDRSYTNSTEAILAADRIREIRRKVDGMYSVIGNHETEYYKNNPFWTLFTHIKSERFTQLRSTKWIPRGIHDTLCVPDMLEDGNVKFIFNHYNCNLVQPKVDGRVTIGLFHKDLYAKEIVEDMKQYGINMYEYNKLYFTENSPLYGYDYAYFGHLHSLYGQYTYICDKTQYKTSIRYLASTGRTNQTEVDNKFLQRNYPAIIVEDGEFVREENNYFNLMSREECVLEEVVKKQQAKYQEIKQVKEKFNRHLELSYDPVTNIKNRLYAYPSLLLQYEEILEGNGSITLSKLQEKLYLIRG